MKLALTLDDAPMITPSSSRIIDAVPDWDAMDAIRVALRELGISHCVAFVIGSVAQSNPEPLVRWLADGYSLGNHTFDHVPAREADAAAFVASVQRSDALLSELGAFPAGRPKWFRFPLLDYGESLAWRAVVRAALRELGYRIAHASTDLYDHAYEGALGIAVKSGAPMMDVVVGRRFRRSALFSVWQSRRLLARHFGEDVPLVLFSHFGRISRDGLAPILRRLATGGATWCSLADAQEHPVYTAMDQDDGLHTGLATGRLQRDLTWKASRKLMQLSGRGRLVQRLQRRFGPTLPAFLNG